MTFKIHLIVSLCTPLIPTFCFASSADYFGTWNCNNNNDKQNLVHQWILKAPQQWVVSASEHFRYQTKVRCSFANSHQRNITTPNCTPGTKTVSITYQGEGNWQITENTLVLAAKITDSSGEISTPIGSGMMVERMSSQELKEASYQVGEAKKQQFEIITHQPGQTLVLQDGNEHWTCSIHK